MLKWLLLERPLGGFDALLALGLELICCQLDLLDLADLTVSLDSDLPIYEGIAFSARIEFVGVPVRRVDQDQPGIFVMLAGYGERNYGLQSNVG